MRFIRPLVLVLVCFSSLAFAAGKRPAPGPSGLIEICPQDASYKYCVFQDPKSKSQDVIYYLHGGGGDEKSWIAKHNQIRDYWTAHKIDAPIIVSFSEGQYWLLAPKSDSAGSGLLELYMNDFMPRVEGVIHNQLGVKAIGQRRILGFSMGSFNGSILAMNQPKVFTSAALACPAMVPVSPYGPGLEDFAHRNGFEVKDIEGILNIAKTFYSETSWLKDSPIDMGKRLLNSDIPPLYISVGQQDKVYREGGWAFKDLAISKGVNVQYLDLPGNHCECDWDSLSRFLVQ